MSSLSPFWLAERMQWHHLAAGYKNMSRPLKVMGNMSCNDCGAWACVLFMSLAIGEEAKWRPGLILWLLLKIKSEENFFNQLLFNSSQIIQRLDFFKKIMCHWLFYMFRETTFQFHSLCTYQWSSRGCWPRGTPGHSYQDICKFPLPRANILPRKATTVLPPGEYNLKGLPNCNEISCIIFNKSLTKTYIHIHLFSAHSEVQLYTL